MKFDCIKVSGKVDYVQVQRPMNGGYDVIMCIDGNVIPNVQLSNKLYEEIDVGEDITFYGIFKKSKRKEKNSGVVYGLRKQSGEKMFATHYRFLVPMMLAVYAAIAFCLVFAIGWFVSWIPVAFLFGNKKPEDFIYHTTVFATVEACIAGGFFLWRAWVIFRVTSDPESWETLEPMTLSSRFSKYHK
jgi:hypothetical protein